jgi:hypothetical protein
MRKALTLMAFSLVWGCAPPAAPDTTTRQEEPAPDVAAEEAKVATPPGTVPLLDALRSIPGVVGEGVGLEDASGWAAAEWADPVRFELLSGRLTGRRVLRVVTSGGSNGKSCVLLARPLALAEKGSARVLAFNRGPVAVNVALALWFGPGFTYYESRARELPPGKWIELRFDLASADWKTASSEWKHTATLWKREDTRQAGVIWYHAGQTGELLIDGLTLPTAGTGK